MKSIETRVSIRLPVGEMDHGSDGSMHIRLSKDQSSTTQMRNYLQTLHCLDNSRFWIPDTDRMEMKDGRLGLYYPRLNSDSKPFFTIVESLQKNPQIGIPIFIELAKFLVECSRELYKTNIPTLPLSPLILFYTSNSSNPWRMAILPFIDSKLCDWAQADPLNWQWIFPDVVLKGERINEDFFYASVIHFCLVGDIFPGLLSRQEKFERVLKGRIGDFSKLNQAIFEALPTTLVEERENLIQHLREWLEIKNTINADQEQIQKCLEQFERDFSAKRLASRWEYEGKPEVALDLLSTYAYFAASEKIPWDVIGRLKEKKSDWEGGLNSRLRALEFGQADAIRDALQFLYRIADMRKDSEKYLFFTDAFNKLTSCLPHVLDEFHILQIAHLEAWYLGEKTGALKRLEKNFNDPWNQLLQSMIIARLLCLQKEYPSVSRHCKKGIGIVNKLPDQGLNKGRYVLSYLQILDGIANFGAVGSIGDVSYVIDAFACFTGALDMALAIEAEDLIAIGAHWLIFLDSYAEHFPPKICRTLKIGINAYLNTKKKSGFEISLTSEIIPLIPWYDELLVFPS